MSEQPYKLGNGGTVGGVAAKAGADIGTAISEGVQAVTGLKKHRANLEHIATQTQLGHERMLEAMSHADSLAAKAKERGQDMLVKADHSSVEYESRSVKEPKSTKEKVVDTVLDVAANALGSGVRKVTGPGGGDVVKPAKAKSTQLALPPGKSDALKSTNSNKMKTFNQNKKARGITGGSRVAAPAARTRSAKNAANPKIYPAGVKSTPEQVKVNVARAWQDKKKTMKASKGAN